MFITRAQYAPGLCVCVRLYVYMCVVCYCDVVNKNTGLRLPFEDATKTHFAAMFTDI